jgi:hypothetical protein
LKPEISLLPPTFKTKSIKVLSKEEEEANKKKLKKILEALPKKENFL